MQTQSKSLGKTWPLASRESSKSRKATRNRALFIRNDPDPSPPRRYRPVPARTSNCEGAAAADTANTVEDVARTMLVDWALQRRRQPMKNRSW